MSIENGKKLISIFTVDLFPPVHLVWALWIPERSMGLEFDEVEMRSKKVTSSAHKTCFCDDRFSLGYKMEERNIWKFHANHFNLFCSTSNCTHLIMVFSNHFPYFHFVAQSKAHNCFQPINNVMIQFRISAVFFFLKLKNKWKRWSWKHEPHFYLSELLWHRNQSKTDKNDAQ